MEQTDHRRDLAIWGYAFGYFACYAPYSALTKALSRGALDGMTRGISGFELLPWTRSRPAVGMFLFLTARGWWRYASTREVLGVRVPFPGRWTFLSGLCSAAIIATTTLAYTFSGTSIVFMMLLMRGGVLILAPLVDVLSRRRVAWPSWVALGLSLGAVGVATAPGVDARVTAAALVDLGVYLVGYFIRLRFMSHLAKGGMTRQADPLLRRGADGGHARARDGPGGGGARRRGAGDPGHPPWLHGAAGAGAGARRAAAWACCPRARASSAASSCWTTGRTRSASR